MEGKKKRWRPSLTAYRELERKYADLDEAYKDLVISNVPCKKYEELQKELESQIEGTSVLVAECDAWREKYDSLLRQFRDYQKRCAGNDGRGFWARVFNRK